MVWLAGETSDLLRSFSVESVYRIDRNFTIATGEMLKTHGRAVGTQDATGLIDRVNGMTGAS